MLGLEVEQMVDAAAALKGFVIGHVESAEQHPNADRLRVCVVNTGSGKFQVVCGAPNARAGMKGVFAPVGSVIPDSLMVLKASKIRGVDSNGMLCSSRELKLGDDHSGIIDLPAETATGAPAAAVLGLDDPMFEIKVTPNRGDCLGVEGIARDLAAAGLGRLKQADHSPVKGSFKSPIQWRRDFSGEDGNACPFVAGRYFRNLKNGPSPQWLQQRLKAIGLRPISALVDITNLLTFDQNRPLHVFDAAKIKGDLTMRLAREGETVTALDNKDYTLDSGMTVIADEDGVKAIGGIMGGAASGCSESTTTMFLEAAYFDPTRTAITGRKLGIQSDARYRFERGIDPTSCLWGIEIATRLVLELCGGEASEVVSAGAMPNHARDYPLRPERVAELTDVEVTPGRAREILAALGFKVKDGDPHGGTWQVDVPSWRPDIVGEADLVEEIVRVHGFDHIPSVPLPRDKAVTTPSRTPIQRRAGQVRRALAARGLVEAVTPSFMPNGPARQFGGGNPALTVVNPISADLDVMRPSILPNLLAAAQRNVARGMKDFGLFEVGPQYSSPEPTGQQTVAAGVLVGATGPRHWAQKPRAVDAFDAKGVALAALAELGIAPEMPQSTADAPAWFHPGRSGVLRLGPVVLAQFGEIHPSIVAQYDLQDVVGFEVFIDKVPMPKPRATRAKPMLKLSPFQAIERDFAFIVDDTVTAEALVKAVKAGERALIAAVTVFDVYAGKGIEPGKKSIALSVTLQPTERTLTDAEIEAISGRMVAQAAKATGATLRT
jgi:phenylalanyl-tRNA synthetase beta chain